MLKSRLNRSGLSVIELMIMLVIVAVIFGAAFGACGSIEGVNTAAQVQAQQYANGLGLHARGIQCANWDSDGDGYVSCTLAVADADGNITPMAVECAAGFNMSGWMNDGCRMPKTVVRGWF